MNTSVLGNHNIDGASRALLDRRTIAGVVDILCYAVLQVVTSTMMSIMLPEIEETIRNAVVVWGLAITIPLLIWSKLLSKEWTYGGRRYGIEIVTSEGAHPSLGRLFIRTALWWAFTVCSLITPISVLIMKNRQEFMDLFPGLM